MNKTLKNIFSSRYDLSDYLFHFTNGSNAKSTLTKILTDKKLKDINNTGVICFTEAPLPSLVEMFDVFGKYNNPMYAPYGVAILKTELFKLGARPVIYGPKSERNLIDSSIEWRYEDYKPNEKDYSWLREWRLNQKEFNLDNSIHFVITKSSIEELDNSFEEGVIEVDGCIADGEFWPEYYLKYEREWKSISIETITRLAIRKSSEVNDNISKQKIGDKTTKYLGSG